MAKISKGKLAWRRKQKRGAIMTTEEFHKIEKGAAKNPKVDNPAEIAGRIYWNRVRHKQKGPKEKK